MNRSLDTRRSTPQVKGATPVPHPDAWTGHERTMLGRRIEAADRESDALVYDLYGLTEAEIALVEGATM